MSTEIKNLDKRIDILEKTIDKCFENMEKATDKRFEDASKRFDILFYTILTMLAGIFGLIGFVIWDRQVSIKSILAGKNNLSKK